MISQPIEPNLDPHRSSYQRFWIDDFLTEAIDKMVEVAKNPVFLARIPYGKHKKMKLDEIPVDYLE